MTEQILRALEMALAMGWQILWPSVLGFTLSGVVQAVVSHQEMARLLPTRFELVRGPISGPDDHDLRLPQPYR
jgi:hypothetical protein